MSWSGLANNQIVSDTNLADACNTGVFVAKTSIPSTNRELTSAAAQTYAYVNTGGSASNQLVAKSDLSQYKLCAYGPYNQYVYATDGNRVYKSTNGGFTFSYFSALPYSPRKGQTQVRYGYSAQQVRSILPEAVEESNNILTVNYSDVHTLKIAALEKRIAELEAKLK